MECKLNTMRNRLLVAAIILMGITACNYTVGECWPRGEGGGTGSESVAAGGGIIIPTGVGGFGDAPPKQPQDATDPKQEIKCNSDEDTESQSDSPAESSTGDESDQEALVKKMLEDPQPEGGVICVAPSDCVKKCVAESKFCWAEYAVHPNKPDQTGALYDCLDSFPKATYGGSYTCLYRYPNGDACIFSYGSKIGPIHLPAPPPLCVYKGGKK
jgi:hypothetical protein